eukprot:5273727-Pleurochrysis_carterae.AAC.2
MSARTVNWCKRTLLCEKSRTRHVYTSDNFKHSSFNHRGNDRNSGASNLNAQISVGCIYCASVAVVAVKMACLKGRIGLTSIPLGVTAKHAGSPYETAENTSFVHVRCVPMWQLFVAFGLHQPSTNSASQLVKA